MKTYTDPDSKLDRILLKSIDVDHDYYIHEAVLHCSVTDGNGQKTVFYKSAEEDFVYILEKTENIFRLKKQLERIEKNEYGDEDTDKDTDEDIDEDTDEDSFEDLDEVIDKK